MSLTNPNKPVTEQRLSEFYQQILPYLGGMPEALANKFSKSDLYSTNEKIVGQWTDGKPLYKKVVTITDTFNSSSQVIKAVDIGATVDNVVSVLGYLHSSGYIGELPYHYSNNNYMMAGAWENTTVETQNKNKVGIAYIGNLTWISSVHIIVQYTKTTDSAISIGNDTDYSTTEKIVGTWIDGKPIYQKTIPYTMPIVTTDGTAVVGNIISIGATISNVIDAKGIVTSSSGLTDIINVYFQSGTNNKFLRLLINNNSANSSKNSIAVQSSATNYNGLTAYITIQYTKTTD